MTKVAFIVNGDDRSPMAYRARALAGHLCNRYQIQLAYRTGNKLLALLRLYRFLLRVKPQVTYVFDISYSGVLAAWLHRRFASNRLIIETGDVIYELMRSTGNRSGAGLWLTRWLEDFSLRVANRIVVRGRYHQQWLAQRDLVVDVIQDGVDSQDFSPANTGHLRAKYGLNGELTIGMVGSSVWSEKLGICYGWELIETLILLPGPRVKGIVIGDGSGIPHLKARCREYGIEDRVLFIGHVPYQELPAYLNMIDVCLSTQTNDLVGQVRTSGKLPLYLAAGRYVLASNVGEAAQVLNQEMLVSYDGVVDRQYPRRLAERIESILAQPQKLARGADNVAVAKEFFEYSKLAERLGEVLEAALRMDVNATQASSGQLKEPAQTSLR